MEGTICNKTKPKKIVCNVCGQLLQEETQQIAEKDWLTVEKSWGYFSDKDREKHRFCVCEDCYDKWVKSFSVPVEVSEETELLLI